MNGGGLRSELQIGPSCGVAALYMCLSLNENSGGSKIREDLLLRGEKSVIHICTPKPR